MKKLDYYITFGVLIYAMATSAVMAQGNVKETFTGTIVSYGTGRNIRTTTNTFTLNLTGVTSDEQSQRSLGILQEGGQDALLKELSKNDFGRFSVGGRLGRTITGVRVSDVGGKKRIFAVFERWIQFAELRGGYRSVDYPFGVIELYIDPRTGKGDGTLIEAAQIRWKRDKKSNEYVVEIENFGTWPAKLMGVTQRGRKSL